uniref:Immunoglobulin V-set domain-containing protein n=1 Tax=Poecilia formosa TaxID=48698 RepID=A0A096M7X2_POEFO
ALQDGETVGTYRGKEGGSITVRCEFGYYGEKRFLCKETCEGKNILIETIKDRDQRGRVSIRYEGRNIFLYDFLHVSITDLKPSDSGRYLCRSDTWKGILYDHFNLVVTEGEFSGLVPSETIKPSENKATASDPLVYVGLVLVVLIVLLAAALLIFFQRKNFGHQKGPPEETEYVNFSKAKDDAVEYSEVHFLNDATTSANSAPCGRAENVTYSEI